MSDNSTKKFTNNDTNVAYDSSIGNLTLTFACAYQAELTQTLLIKKEAAREGSLWGVTNDVGACAIICKHTISLAINLNKQLWVYDHKCCHKKCVYYHNSLFIRRCTVD